MQLTAPDDHVVAESPLHHCFPPELCFVTKWRASYAIFANAYFDAVADAGIHFPRLLRHDEA